VFQDSSQAISLEVIIRAVFGVQDRTRINEVRKKIVRFATEMSPVLFFFPFLQRSFGGFGPWARFVKLKQEVTAILHAEVKSRRQASDPGSDILSMLLAARHED